MSDIVNLRRMTPNDYGTAINLARSLPEFFNDQGIAEITVDIRTEIGAVAVLDGELVGFVTWSSAEALGRIGWIAVSRDHHRQGIGRRLLEFVESNLRQSGVTTLQVDTLGESVDYEPYDRTRSFYRSVGFSDLRSVMLDNPGMPEMLTLEKALTD
ncbi:MAG: GNAT family N-acetyltransferase [Acidimicrobiia bacterium]|nr:GNAT family N-acetyltransferase [Acidimicrobiia bacterium]NNC91343.1 GNAT family N-acetyltransferase [Acidimicrobiia bacterium]